MKNKLNQILLQQNICFLCFAYSEKPQTDWIEIFVYS